jgi:hypothetical protein
MSLSGFAIIGVLAKAIDLVLPDKNELLYNRLQGLLKKYKEGLEQGKNSQATRALAELKAELKKLGFTEGL